MKKITSNSGWMVGFLAVSLLVTTLNLYLPTSASATSGSDFQAGYIISDTNFFDAASLNEVQIQTFLESQSCAPSGGVPCLKDYTQSTPDVAAVGGGHCAAYAGASNERASTIIAKVSRACGINPKVLIVLLQKEQSLITRPSPYGYARAMGWGCPDSGPNFSANCDANFFGFFNQTYKSAWQFRQYTQFPSGRTYRIGTVFVQYHPNPACGGTNINIVNQATANLYLYTPYQPNESALNNLYGVGDGCGTYGNRNFWRMYTDWFGNTSSSVGPSQIELVYQIMGGRSGTLGAATTGYNELASNGSGIVKGYTNGAIAWSPSRGAYPLYGEIRTAFNNLGGIAGSLGWPSSAINAIARDGGGGVQSFQGGAITSTSAGGAILISGAVRDAFNAVGGLLGPMSWPTAVQTCTSGSSCSQEFRGGTLSVSPGTGAIISNGAVASAYSAAGGAEGSLGAISGSIVPNMVHGSGLVLPLANGAIAWSSAFGAHSISGEVRARFGAEGGLAGALGWPAADQVCVNSACSQEFQGGTIFVDANGGSTVMDVNILDLYKTMGGADGAFGAPSGTSSWLSMNGGGIVQGFTHGAITYTNGSGAVALADPMRAGYSAQGGLAGGLGWPQSSVSTASTNGGGLVQGFQNGALTWTAQSGVVALKGEIRAAFAREGGLAGSLGWPLAPSTPVGSGAVQGFQNGAITSSPSEGTHAISGEIRTLYGVTGGLSGRLGWPASDVNAYDANGGGFAQGFANGAITRTDDTGAVLVEGPIRAFYNTLDGMLGDLGWPLSGAKCQVSGICSQPFTGGIVDVSAEGVASLRAVAVEANGAE